MLKLIQEAEKLQKNGRWQDAAKLYETALAGDLGAAKHVAWFNLGTLLSQNEKLVEAENAYRSAIFAKPDFIQAWFNLGAVVEKAGRKPQAIKVWQSMVDHPLVSRLVEVDMYVMVLNSLGRIHEEIREFEKSEAYLLESLLTQPDQPKVIQHWVHLRQKQCKWPVYEVPEGTDAGELMKWTSPLAMLSASDDPGMQLATAMRFVQEKVNLKLQALPAKKNPPHTKLRIGFLSSDFCLHAVSLLTVELLELLDRTRFEVYGFCWSREDGSALQKRMIAAMDHHVRIGHLSDEEAAKNIQDRSIDILIDLQGITSGARPNILSYRPAPIQMTYLGFPGTTGHPCIDYVIADRFLIPVEMKPYYSEKPFYMPDVFQCSDRQRPVGPKPKKSTYGLPEDKFVFCTFNNNYKFTPSMFSAWMRVLQQVPNSVFWLLEDNIWSKNALIEQAQRHGIGADRLVFAGRVAPENYLARYTLADLFLDAYPFNGGTTANDALWMRLPVLTLTGKVFASRMAGSLLNALGMPELITQDLEDYVSKAVTYGNNPSVYKTMKKRLEKQAKTSALFDMPRFVRNFENGLLALESEIKSAS
jgi:predicted O-linked N-acetylglucosamine transferase (SPINDLY family)